MRLDEYLFEPRTEQEIVDIVESLKIIVTTLAENKLCHGDLVGAEN